MERSDENQVFNGIQEPGLSLTGARRTTMANLEDDKW